MLARYGARVGSRWHPHLSRSFRAALAANMGLMKAPSPSPSPVREWLACCQMGPGMVGWVASTSDTVIVPVGGANFCSPEDEET